MLHRFAMACPKWFGKALLASLLAAIHLQPVHAAPSPAAQALANAPAAILEGVLEVEVADFPDRSSTIYHFLRTSNGERRELKLPGGRPAGLVSGTRVRVKGRLSGNVVTAEASLVPLTTSTIDTQAAALPYATGAQRTAVILVNFQDKITSPQTVSTVQNLVFGQVSNFYLENSFQTTSVSGNVFGWYTIPVSSTSCNMSAIKTYARSAAIAAGADLSGYSRFIYMFPNTSACSWAGYGTIGGSPTDAWINGYFDRRIVAHELGHNLGLYHAHGLNCDASPIGNTCSSSEYGDPVDTMGWGLYGHFSAYQKEALGWLNYGGMPPITTVQATGTYQLAPYAGSGTGAKALKILKSTNPTTGEKTWYYLEYRQPTGFDNVLAGNGNLTAGVGIRTASTSAGTSLLDMTTNSNLTSDYNDMLDSTLAVGRSFTDTNAGIKVTVTRADTSGASVDVLLGSGGTASCLRARPSVLMSPSQAASVAAGTAVTYTVAVNNADSTACGSSIFNLARILPSGWSGSLASPTLTIPAGSAASTTLTAVSPATAVAGSYSVGATATNATSALSGSSTAVYSVASTLAETVATDKATYTRGSTVTTTATVKNNGIPVANATVTFKMTKNNGELLYFTTATNNLGQAVYRYTLSLTDPTGYYRSGATATSGNLSAYTSTSFMVQ